MFHVAAAFQGNLQQEERLEVVHLCTLHSLPTSATDFEEELEGISMKSAFLALIQHGISISGPHTA